MSNSSSANSPDLISATGLESILKKHLGSSVFKGVFAANNLPKPPPGESFKFPFAFVVNTECAHKSGQHWVAFYFDHLGKAHYFDSFGRLPMFRDWINYLLKHSDSGLWEYNKADIQKIDSELCGGFCVYYLICRHFTDLSVNDYILVHKLNENKLSHFVNKL